MGEDERQKLIDQYGDGVRVFSAAMETVPIAAMKWRPAPGAWSVHEIVCHCADSETNAASRIRYLTAEKDLLLEGYNPDVWATTFDYHSHPLDVAVRTIEAVRANTAALIRRLPDAVWERDARHKTKGRYSAQDWLRTYAAHLTEHAAQIDSNVAAWHEAQRARTR
jgi:hypothetical protein